MAEYLGDFPTQATFHKILEFKAGGELVEPAGLTLAAYKNGSDVQTTTGPVVTDTSFDALPGLVLITMTCTDAFYAAGSEIAVIATAGTLAGVSLIGTVLFSFSVERTNGVLAQLKTFLAAYQTTLMGPSAVVVADGANTAQSFEIDVAGVADVAADWWVDAWLSFEGTATLAHQTRRITDFNQATSFVSVSSPYTAPPTAGDTARLVTR